MLHKKKLNELKYVVATSGESVQVNTYAPKATYVTSEKLSSDVTSMDLSTDYGGIENEIKVSTPSTRQQDNLLQINKKLKDLEKFL